MALLVISKKASVILEKRDNHHQKPKAKAPRPFQNVSSIERYGRMQLRSDPLSGRQEHVYENLFVKPPPRSTQSNVGCVNTSTKNWASRESQDARKAVKTAISQ